MQLHLEPNPASTINDIVISTGLVLDGENNVTRRRPPLELLSLLTADSILTSVHDVVGLFNICIQGAKKQHGNYHFFFGRKIIDNFF